MEIIQVLCQSPFILLIINKPLHFLSHWYMWYKNISGMKSGTKKLTN